MATLPIHLKGKRTEKNLAAALASKAMASNRYTYFASKAKKQGYEQISALFLETAGNEMEHAKQFMAFMSGDGTIPIRTTVLAASINTTLENLRLAAQDEAELSTKTYPMWAEVAESEGFNDIAKIFTVMAEVSEIHAERFQTLAHLVQTRSVFKRRRLVRWKCRNCGYVSEGPEAPKECPACGHEISFYEIKEVLE